MSIRGYIREKLGPPENLGCFSLCLMPIGFIVFYALSYYTNSSFIFYVGIFICGILFIYPLMLLIAVFLLWKNPQKYKEYEMKQLRKKKDEERNKYLLIFLYFLWINPKEIKNQIEGENTKDK